MLIKVSGMYERTRYRNEENGFTIFTISSKEYAEYKTSNGYLVCCGKIPIYTKGIPVCVTGELQKGKKGYRINVKEIEEKSEKEEFTIKYLSSDAFNGIGEKTARKIINVTGYDIFEFIKQPNAEEILFNECSELGKDKIKKFIRTIRNTIDQRKVFEYIHKFGGNYTQASTLYNKYGTHAIKILKEDPYKVGEDAEIPFCVCDSIGKSENVYAFDKDRINFMVYETMKHLADAGNTYVTLKILYKAVKYMSLNSAYSINVPAPVIACELSNNKRFVLDKVGNTTRIYLKTFWDIENNSAKEMFRIQNSSIKLKYDNNIIEKLENKFNIKYSDSQKQCFNFLRSSGVKIVCGSAGTGKTTIQKGLIEAYKTMYPNNIISLAAPTGRASQRMTESTGFKSTTIHKLLDINFSSSGELSLKDKNNQLESDFLIIDEASMIDAKLFSLLLNAIKSNALVILCGDPNQLPSVGAGNILKDIIDSKLFDCNTLNVVYRQLNNSSILYNANAVKSGNSRLKTDSNFKIFRYSSQQEIGNVIADIYTKEYNPNNPFDVQVLSLVKKGDAGVNVLNKRLQSFCNEQLTLMSFNNYSFKIGDRIMTISNNYEIDYLNGEMGTITDITTDGMSVKMNDKEILIPPKYYKDVVLAYAATVHKSQGSEFNTVIISLTSQSACMLNRNLLYTAITRAKKKVYIIFEDNALEFAISHIQTNSRKTTFCEKLIKAFNSMSKIA